VSDKKIKAFYNWLSLTGFIVTANSLILILILYLYSVLSSQADTYLGLYIYIILPVFLVLGLILIPLGVVISIRKRKAAQINEDSWPVIDLNTRKDWATVVKIFLITNIFLVASAMGSFRAFHLSKGNNRLTSYKRILILTQKNYMPDLSACSEKLNRL